MTPAGRAFYTGPHAAQARCTSTSEDAITAWFRRDKLAAIALSVGLIWGATVGGAAGCSGCESEGGDVRRLVPADASFALLVPSLERFRGRMVAYLAGVEGTSGVIDLIRSRYGVDLGSAEGVRRAGIDPEAGVAVFAAGRALGLAFGVTDAGRFDDLAQVRASKGAGATVSAAAGEPELRKAEPPGDSPAWRIAWGVTADSVGLLVATSGDGDPVAVWRELDGQGGGLFESERARAAAEEAGPDASMWAVGELEPPIPDLGNALAIVRTHLMGLRQWQASVTVDDERLSLRADGRLPPDRKLPADWFRPAGEVAPFGTLMPKTTTALVRMRLDVAKIRAIPAFLRDRMLPAVPNLDGLPLPTTTDLVEQVRGDVAVALLGLDPETTVTHILAKRLRPATFLQLVHMAALFDLRDPAAFATLLDATAERARQAKWTVGAIDRAGWRGYTYVKKTHTYSFILKDGVAAFLSGGGEVERFLAVAEGRALNLASHGTDGVPGAALGTDGSSLGVLVSFTRITRELADKGMPPYFLKIINDVRLVSAAARADATGVELVVEVAQ